MAENSTKVPDVDLLPVWQRIAWMAAIWTLSVGSMALVAVAVRSLLD